MDEMGLFQFFKKKEKAPPKETQNLIIQMSRNLEGQKLVNEAISYRNLGNFDKAFSLLEKALFEFTYTPAVTLIGTTMVLKGDIDHATQWFLEMIQSFSNKGNPSELRKALDVIDPTLGDGLLIELYANIGSIYNKYRKDYCKALQMYEKALIIPKPNSIGQDGYSLMISNIHHDMAIVHLNLGDFVLARKYAMKRLEVQPNCNNSKAIIAHCDAQDR
jgi:tetratricopeptide (TPR) repeat protein